LTLALTPDREARGNATAAAELPRDSERSPAVLKAVALLDILSRNRRPLGVSDLARSAGIPKSSAHNLLAALASVGLVYRVSGTAEYVLGGRILELASRFLDSDALNALYADAAREFVVETGETVQMGRLEGTQVVYIARFEGHRAIQLTSRVGTRIHASTSAMGKAALSMLPDEEIRHRYAGVEALPIETGRSISTLSGLLAEVQHVRLRDGVAVDDEENAIGLRCYGVPLFEITGLCYAASSTITASGHSKEEEQGIIAALQRLRRVVVDGTTSDPMTSPATAGTPGDE
jgi:DNA-binding IclR family transcriptional regulator